MTNELIPVDEYGPKMQALSDLKRNFVLAYFEHPQYSASQLAREAGYTDNPDHPNQIRVRGSLTMRSPDVLEAIQEESGRRLRSLAAIGVTTLAEIALNPTHKDRLKAAGMILDRTGFHAMSEHKVTVDDKRPQTKQELIAAVKSVAQEAGLDADAIKKLTGEDVVEAEFTEIDPVDQEIQQQMEDL